MWSWSSWAWQSYPLLLLWLIYLLDPHSSVLWTLATFPTFPSSLWLCAVSCSCHQSTQQNLILSPEPWWPLLLPFSTLGAIPNHFLKLHLWNLKPLNLTLWSQISSTFFEKCWLFLFICWLYYPDQCILFSKLSGSLWPHIFTFLYSTESYKVLPLPFTLSL